MPPPADQPVRLGREDFVALVEAVKTAIAEVVSKPALLTQEQAWSHLGVSRAAFFRLKGSVGFPREVFVPGSGIRYRRADLDRWTAGLKSSRKK